MNKLLKYFLVFSFCVLNLKIQAQQTIDQIVGTIDNYIILDSDVEKLYLNMLYEKKITDSDPQKAKCQILEQLAIQKMMLAKAEIDSVIVEDREVTSQLDRRIEYIIRGVGGNIELLEKQYGKTLNDIKEELRDAIKEQMTVQKMERTLTEKIDITPKEVKKFYDAIPKDTIPYFNAEVEVGHIVKIPEVNKAQKQTVKDKLIEIRNRVMNGEDFGDLAKQYSEDYGSAKEKGSLGWNKRGNLVPPFEAAIFKMKPGEMSQPVESEYGFHLIRLVERRGNEYNSEHILIRPNFDDVDKASTERFLDSLRNRIVSDSIAFEKAAKEFSEDKATAPDGGKLRSQTSGDSKIFIDEIEPTIYFIIDTMKVGDVSRPVPYRTDDGRNGLRIIYFKSKTQPHQANLKDDYQKIYNFALTNKKNKAINEWFKKTKDQLFINIDEKYKECSLLEKTE